MSTELLRIFDTTLRDGEQSPGCSMNLHEKLTLARQLEKLGVDVIEAGFPIASEGDFEAVRAVARELKETCVCGLARTGSAGRRARRAGAGGRGAPAHPHLHRDQRHPPRAQAAHEPRAGAGRGRPRGAPGARLLRRRRVLGRGRHALGPRLPGRGLPRRARGRRRRRSTCPTRSATRSPRSTRR